MALTPKPRHLISISKGTSAIHRCVEILLFNLSRKKRQVISYDLFSNTKRSDCVNYQHQLKSREGKINI